MRIAVISDIHGNLAALQAVLEDLPRHDVDTICCGGDLVGYGPFPNEVIALLRSANIPCVMGNYDDAVGNRRITCGCAFPDQDTAGIANRSLEWTGARVSEENREYLKNLPFALDVGTASCSVHIVHGSPRRLNEYLHQEIGEKELNEFLCECTAQVVVCGHTHVPYYKNIAGKLLVNAGSVGQPKHGNPRASYCIIDINGQVGVRIHYLPYDFESTAQAISANGLPEALAQIIRTGRG